MHDTSRQEGQQCPQQPVSCQQASCSSLSAAHVLSMVKSAGNQPCCSTHHSLSHGLLIVNLLDYAAWFQEERNSPLGLSQPDSICLGLICLGLTYGLQDAVHEQQRTAAVISRGGSAGSGAEAGPGSAPDNAGQPLNYLLMQRSQLAAFWSI